MNQIRRNLLYLAIFFIPLSGLKSFVPYFTYSLIFFFLYIILFSTRLQRKSRNPQNRYAFGALTVLIGLIIFSSFVNFEPNTLYSFSFIRQFMLYLFVFYFLSYAMLGGLLSLKLVLKYYILGVTVLIVLNFLGIGRVINEDGRLLLLGMNPNKISISASVAVLFCINLLKYYRHSVKKRFLIYATIPALIYLMISTGSRGGVIGLALAVLVYFFYKEQGFVRKFQSISIGIFIVVTLALVSLSNDILYNRFFATDDAGLLEDRFLIWSSVQKILSENLLFGVGVFKYETEITRLMGYFVSVHNEFLTIITFSGVIGLLFFIFFLFKVLRAALKSAKKLKNPLFISLFVLLLFTLFKAGGSLLSMRTWFLFAFTLYSSEILTFERNFEEE